MNTLVEYKWMILAGLEVLAWLATFFYALCQIWYEINSLVQGRGGTLCRYRSYPTGGYGNHQLYVYPGSRFIHPHYRGSYHIWGNHWQEAGCEDGCMGPGQILKRG